jgi:SAM-dependent methyltransferase
MKDRVIPTSGAIPEEVLLENNSCPLGCDLGDTRLFTAADRVNGLLGCFTLVKCNCCGLIRTNPRPTPETIGYYYPSNYGPYLGTKIPDIMTPPNLIRRTLNRLIDFRSEAIPNLYPGKALEIGCASGSFLSKLASRGWDVTGVEFSLTAAIAARQSGFTVYQGALENVSLLNKKFDLVVGWMVLEHLHQPITVLKKLHAASAPDAWLVISVPNCAGGLERFRADWFPLHVPNHLFHFTQGTLRALLHKGGWEMRRCMQQRVFIDLPLSLALVLQSRNVLPWLSKILLKLINGKAGLIFNVLFYPLALVMAATGNGSRMTVWAQRKDQAAC